MRALEGLKILLVEEEILIAMDVEQLCYEHGAVAVATISSEAKLTPEALDSIEARAAVMGADAAILDVRVGAGSTSELARRLKKQGIPFVFATGYTAAEPFFAEFPDVAVVAKPYASEELTRAVAAAVASVRSGDRG